VLVGGGVGLAFATALDFFFFFFLMPPSLTPLSLSVPPAFELAIGEDWSGIGAAVRTGGGVVVGTHRCVVAIDNWMRWSEMVTSSALATFCCQDKLHNHTCSLTRTPEQQQITHITFNSSLERPPLTITQPPPIDRLPPSLARSP